MYLSIIIVIQLIWTIVCENSDQPKVESLCDNPVIHSADRLLNNSIRLYRGDYYWELIGLPDRVGGVNGPYKIWYPNMAPIDKNASTHTGLAGDVKGIHYKFVGTKWWSWLSNGRQRNGGTNTQGTGWAGFPPNGFTAAYHDGNASGKGYPMMIGFQNIRIYYFNTKSYAFNRVGNRDGYIGGRYNETFPGDITAAFSWPSDDPNVKYFVYLFRRDKHCFRPWISKNGKDCDEWRDNKELFGCYKGEGQPASKSPEIPSEIPPEIPSEVQPPKDPADTETKTPKNIGFKSQSSTLFVVSIYFILNLL